jgi:pathogenesis-related protein 1
MTPQHVMDLLEKLRRLEAIGKRDGVGWADAALAARYRGNINQFHDLIYRGDEASHTTVNGVLRAWVRLLQDKKAAVEEARGVTPKATVPPKAIKVVAGSVAETIGLGPAQCQVMLDAHNRHRRSYGARELVYDERLAAKAQAWANHLANRLVAGHKLEHSTVTLVDGLAGETGENLATEGGTGYAVGEYEPNHAKPVDDWVAEVKDYDMVKKAPKPRAGMTGHFTQVVWKATTRVGCGFVLVYLPGDKFVAVWVCNYHPAGNYDGEHGKNV